MDDLNINTALGGNNVPESGDDEWEVDAAEEQTSSENGFTLKYLGETLTVDKDKAVELAQKGMDYDRIRRRFETLKTAAFKESADPAAVKRTMDIDEFLEDYPGITPDAIPLDVWHAVKNGRSLSEAYTRWENSRIKLERETAAQQSAAAERSPGSRYSGPVKLSLDEFTRELLG